MRPAKPRAEQAVEGLPMFAAPSVPVATSEDAAESVRGKVDAAHRLIRSLLRSRNLSTPEFRMITGWEGDFARPRMWELEGMQHIEKCDGEQGRPLDQCPTRSGRTATRYRLTNLGRRIADEAR